MLAILPGYDDSDEGSNSSESEVERSDSEVKGQSKEETDVDKEPPQKDVPLIDAVPTSQCIDRGRDLESPQKSTAGNRSATATVMPDASMSSSSRIADNVSSSSGHLASCSGLNSEQTSVLKYLALKRRKDEELRQLEEAERLESRRLARKRRKGKGAAGIAAASSASVSGPTEDLHALSSYLGVNDHLRGALVDHGDLGPKSGLEKEIDEAVAAGDVDKAEQLSNYLSSRNFGVRVTEAANARDYAKRKQEEEEKKMAKKKAKLAWGFEVKHRWEMKGNM